MVKNTEEMPVVFTAQSKAFFYCRDAICEFVLSRGCLPLNPFRVFEYFLGDRVARDLVRRGNNNLIRISQQLWVFGIVADGVLFEIEYALRLETPIRFFTMATRAEDIREITDLSEVRFEPELHSSRLTREELLVRIGAQRTIAQLSLFGSSLHSSMQSDPLPSCGISGDSRDTGPRVEGAYPMDEVGRPFVGDEESESTTASESGLVMPDDTAQQ